MQNSQARDWKSEAELLEEMQAIIEQDLHERKYLRTHWREGRERKPRRSGRQMRLAG